MERSPLCYAVLEYTHSLIGEREEKREKKREKEAIAAICTGDGCDGGQ